MASAPRLLAPHAAWRSAVIPGRSEAEEEGPPAAVGSPRESASRWAALLRRVFAIDVFACPRCGGRRRLVGVHTGGECTPGASRCGPCSSGWASGARCPRGSRRGRRRARRSNRTGLSVAPPWDRAFARVCLPPAFGRWPRSADRQEGRVVEGAPLRSRAWPSRRRWTWAAGGAIVARGGGRGRVATAKARLEFLRSNGLRLVEDYRWQPITNRWLERWDVPHGGPEPRT